ncbi:MAG: exosortase/archaeosortase family protein [Verrucomicrobiota bacterium]
MPALITAVRNEAEASRLPLPLLLYWGATALLFTQLFFALYPSWTDGTYYDYGLLAPIILLLVYKLRWNEESLPIGSLVARMENLQRSPLSWILLFSFLLLLIPLRLIESVEASWRAPLLLHGSLLLGLIGYFQFRLFGSKGLLSFLPVAVLTFLVIPLPTYLETNLIEGLTNAVTETAATAVRWSGIPVEVAGQTLILDNLPLHVAEGCSGIRSFQSSVFAAILIGEFFRLSLLRRTLLLSLGVAAAFLFNATRVVYLVFHAANHGDANLQSMHDLSGQVSMVATFLLLGLGAIALRRGGNPDHSTVRDASRKTDTT